MLSTELPVTEWWDPDPDWPVYDVPGSPEGAPHDLWWAAYNHVWYLEWIMTGSAWYSPHPWQNQLTAGPASVSYLGAWPWPCSCEYVVFDCPWPARWAIASGFRIHSDCPQHGDDAHA